MKNSPRTFLDMYYAYLLQSGVNFNKFYIGSTNNLQRRLREHNQNYNRKKFDYISRYLPRKIIYYEAFFSEKDAREREHMLKHHGKGLSELKKRLRNSIQL